MRTTWVAPPSLTDRVLGTKSSGWDLLRPQDRVDHLLGDFPLAINRMANCMLDAECSLEAFLEMFSNLQDKKELLESSVLTSICHTRPPLGPDESDPTWLSAAFKRKRRCQRESVRCKYFQGNTGLEPDHDDG